MRKSFYNQSERLPSQNDWTAFFLVFCQNGIFDRNHPEKLSDFLFRFVYFDALQTAFQYERSQEGIIHKGAFQKFQCDFDADFSGFVPITLMQIAMRMIQHMA